MGDTVDLVEKSRIMDAVAIKRALSRLSMEIVEKNKGAEDLYLVGIRRRGVPLAERIRDKVADTEDENPSFGILDITLYRDDLSTVGTNPVVNRTELVDDIEGKNIVLVDDVLYTGRTIRAALDAIIDYGRPRRVQVAVLVDRGRRELPICGQFVGIQLDAAAAEQVNVRLAESGALDQVVIE